MRGHMNARAFRLRFVAGCDIVVVPCLGARIDHGIVRIMRKAQIVRTFCVGFFIVFLCFFHTFSLQHMFGIILYPIKEYSRFRDGRYRADTLSYAE